MPDIPEPHVTAHLHGGPHDGETVSLPWARIEMAFPRWHGSFIEDAREDLYRLRGKWHGEAEAHYEFVEPDQLTLDAA